MDNEFKTWKSQPDPDNYKALMNKVKPVINSAISLYVGSDDTAAKSKAKVLASKAIKKYDPSKGTKLKTHLMTQLQPLRRFAAKYRSVTHIPEEAQRHKYLLNEARKELEDKLDREPSDIELADRTGFTVKRIRSLNARNKPLSESSLEYQPGVTNKSKSQTWADYVYYDLPNIDRKIMEWKTGYGNHKTLSNNDIARKLKLTPAAVSQRAANIAKRIEEGI